MDTVLDSALYFARVPQGRLGRIADATKHLEQQQMSFLRDHFGTRSRFRHGRGFHHLDHATEVARWAEAIVRWHVACGDLPAWAPFAARLAGLFHDHNQDHDRDEEPGVNEALSIEAAVAAMEQYEEFDEEFVDLVVSGIDATQILVLDVPGARIVQNATAAEPFRAALADSDLGPMGAEGGNYQQLGLYVELNREELAVGEWAGLRDVDPDPRHASAWLLDQVPLRRRHRYLLLRSRLQFPYQQLHAAQMQRLGGDLECGDLTWHGLVDYLEPRRDVA